MLYKDREVGEVRSGNGASALAMLRTDALSEAEADGAERDAFRAGEARLTPHTPTWFRV